MLQIGKTYRLRGKPVDVEIVASGVDSGTAIYLDNYQGLFFVGITRNDGPFGDWVGCYEPDGTRLWEQERSPNPDRWSLILPEPYVNLNQVLNLIQTHTTLNRDELDAALHHLPTRDL